jgi:hypothetical protein
MGGRRFALLGVAIALACSAFGCVGDDSDAADDDPVATAQSDLNGEVTAGGDVAYAEGEVTTPGTQNEDPEPSPWVPGADPAGDEATGPMPGDPGDPADPGESDPATPNGNGNTSKTK